MRVHSRWRDGGHIFDDLLDVCVCVRGGGGGGGGGVNEPWSRGAEAYILVGK